MVSDLNKQLSLGYGEIFSTREVLFEKNERVFYVCIKPFDELVKSHSTKTIFRLWYHKDYGCIYKVRKVLSKNDFMLSGEERLQYREFLKVISGHRSGYCIHKNHCIEIDINNI